MEGRGLFQVFTARALWGSAVGAWPALVASTDFVLSALELFWRKHGLPDFAQLITTSVSKVGTTIPMSSDESCALCLSLGVTPVFAPPLESGFQASIENFNGLWQRKVWERFHHETLETLNAVSIALPRLTPRVWIVCSIPNTIPRVALFQRSGPSIYNANHAVESSTSVAPTSPGRSNFWAIAFPWIHSGLIGSPGAKSTWSGTRSTAFASGVALLTTNPSSPHSLTNFPNDVSTPAHGTNIP